MQRQTRGPSRGGVTGPGAGAGCRTRRLASRGAAPISDPEQLKELLGIPFTPEQLSCVTAPPAPGVIVAGRRFRQDDGDGGPGGVAGRHRTGRARAGARADVHQQGGGGAVRAGAQGPGAGRGDRPRPGRPRHRAGRAADLHLPRVRRAAAEGPRPAHRPGAQLPAARRRHPLPARRPRAARSPRPLPVAHQGPVRASSPTCSRSTASCPSTWWTRRCCAPTTPRSPSASGRWTPRNAASPGSASDGRRRRAHRPRRPGDRLPRAQEAPRPARLRRPDRAVGDAGRHPPRGRPDPARGVPAWCCSTSTRTPRSPNACCSPGCSARGTGHPVTAVGDPCQAIYGWRGASVANLDDFPVHFPHARRHPGEALQRSARTAAAAAGCWTSPTRLAAPLRARHEGVEALRPAPGAERDGLVALRAAAHRRPRRSPGSPTRSRHLVDTGTPPGEIAVLCRTAGDFADIHAALVARDVPVEVVGLSGLLHLPEVADLVATCEVLHDPDRQRRPGPAADRPALADRPARPGAAGPAGPAAGAHRHRGAGPGRAGAGPSRASTRPRSSRSPTRWRPSSTRPPTTTGCRSPPQARVRFARLATEIRELRRSLADPLMDVLHRVLAVTGLEVELSASPHALAARRRETLRNFLDIAAGFAALDGEATLLAFLASCAPPTSTRRGWTARCPAARTPSRCSPRTSPRAWSGTSSRSPAWSREAFPSAKVRELWPWHAKVLPHGLRGDAATLPDVADWTQAGPGGVPRRR